MGLWEIYQGHQTWEEYLNSQRPFAEWAEIPPPMSPSDAASSQPNTEAVAVGLSASDYQLARASGLGRENGVAAIDEYLETKSVWVELSGGTRDPFTLG